MRGVKLFFKSKDMLVFYGKFINFRKLFLFISKPNETSRKDYTIEPEIICAGYRIVKYINIR